MADTVADMTRAELEALLELLVDPDGGLEVQERVRERPLEQQRAIARGERGAAFEDVLRDPGLG